MARPTESEEIPWFKLGIFKWFNFTQETIKEFSIDSKASTIVRKEVRMKLAQKHVDGTCKTCGQKSRVAFGNPSNWVRHLLVSRYFFIPRAT